MCKSCCIDMWVYDTSSGPNIDEIAWRMLRDYITYIIPLRLGFDLKIALSQVSLSGADH